MQKSQSQQAVWMLISRSAPTFGLCGALLLIAAAAWAQRQGGGRPIGFFDILLLPRVWMGAIFCLIGLGLHPSPICTISRPFQFLDAGRSVPVVFWAILVSIAVLSLVGNKLFCGWVCPIGAIQEGFHQIPLPKKLKIKLPFRVTNIIRTHDNRHPRGDSACRFIHL